MYKKYQRGANVADEMDNALLVTTVGVAASGVGLLSTITAAPVALGLQAGAIVCGMLGVGGKIDRPEASSKTQETRFDPWPSRVKTKHNRRPLSTVLTDDEITEEEFRLIFPMVDKYNQMKAEIRGHQKQSGGLSEDEKKQAISACERRSDDDSPRQVI